MRFSSPNYSTWPGRGLFLEDLFVREAFPNRGIGKALLPAGRQSKKGVTEYTGKDEALQQLVEKAL
jgi:hypothetical protein